MCKLKLKISPVLALLILSFPSMASAKIDVGQSELRILESDLFKIREPERKVARIDQTLVALLSRTNSIGEPVQTALRLRKSACENVARKYCPPTPNLSRELCSPSRLYTFTILDVWTGLLPTNGWKAVLENCSAQASVGQTVGGIVAFNQLVKIKSGTEAVAALEWSDLKFSKLTAVQKESVFALLKGLPGGKTAAKQMPSPQQPIDVLSTTLLAGVYTDYNLEILVRYPKTVKKIAKTLQYSSGGDSGNSLSTLVSLGFYEEANALYQSRKDKFTDTWDIYSYCILNKLTGKFQEAIACARLHTEDKWFQYEQFDALMLSGQSKLAHDVLGKLKDWTSPYLILAKVQAGEHLSKDDITRAGSMVTKEYAFGFYLLGQNLNGAGFTPKEISQMTADFKRSFSNRFLAQNFDQRKPLEEIANALGKFHIISRSVAYRFKAKL